MANLDSSPSNPEYKYYVAAREQNISNEQYEQKCAERGMTPKEYYEWCEERGTTPEAMVRFKGISDSLKQAYKVKARREHVCNQCYDCQTRRKCEYCWWPNHW